MYRGGLFRVFQGTLKMWEMITRKQKSSLGIPDKEHKKIGGKLLMCLYEGKLMDEAQSVGHPSAQRLPVDESCGRSQDRCADVEVAHIKRSCIWNFA